MTIMNMTVSDNNKNVSFSRSYDVFTVGASAQNWSQPAPSRPLPRVPASTPAAEEMAVKESPPPPYSTAVYDPNATDELQEWEERNI